MTSLIKLSGIYALLGHDATPALLDAVLRGGVRIIQYRNKRGVDSAFLGNLCAIAHNRAAIVIVNDDLEAALTADGLHLGQEDLLLHDTGTLRERLGERVLGISCATPEDACRAERIGADYVGVGPYNETSSKSDAGPAIGIAGIRAVAQATHLPVVAIGGIEIDDLDAIARSGASMAAVQSAITRAQDPQAYVRALVNQWALQGKTHRNDVCQ